MSNVIQLSETHEKNLRRLATYLWFVERHKFDMPAFDDDMSQGYDRTTCGTSGCALGHGPYAGIEKRKTEGWMDYGYRVFGLSEAMPAWWFIFDSSWAEYDNTPRSAARRIFWVLNNGVPAEKEIYESYQPKSTDFVQL